MDRLIAGIHAAIEFSEGLIDAAYYVVPREQVYHHTKHHRALLKAQLMFLSHLEGKR
jgi:hypothetical protein